MKDLVVSFLIIAFLVGGWLIFDSYSHQLTTNLSQDLSENIIPLTEAENWQDAANLYDKFEKNWDDYKKVSLCFLENNQISELDLCIARAEKYIEAEDVSNAAGELCSIAKQLSLLDQREKVTLSNIL